MSDVFTTRKRSAVMSAIRAKNTKPELIVRRMLHLMGYRFRLHVADLPGKPDVVIARVGTILQVKGCFWHGHRCLRGRVPIANRTYWLPKILGNRSRDQKNERRLRSMGWRVVTIWECTIRRSSPEDLYQTLRKSLGVRRSAGIASTRLSSIESALKAIRWRKARPNRSRRGKGLSRRPR